MENILDIDLTAEEITLLYGDQGQGVMAAYDQAGSAPGSEAATKLDIA
jgi:hypothetical protein